MSQLFAESQQRKEVSESAFEYLLGEIMSRDVATADGEEMASVLEKRQEQLGYDVGYRILERVSTGHKFIGTDHLDLVKFICKEFWEEVFKKKVQNRY